MNNNNNNNSGVKVSIPNTLRKTIQNLKEITGNHSEDEIYTMLKDCNMDPNETAQKLLSQDPFHEVRRKGNRKKENLVKESAEAKWKPGMQGRGNRGGRGNSNYPSRQSVHDAASSRKALSGKENEINQGAVDGVIPPAPRDKKNKAVASSSVIADKKEPEVKILTAALGDLSVVSVLPESQQTSFEKPNEVSVENKRPPSNYNNRAPQVIGSHKVGSAKEWKPKPTNPIPVSVPVEVEVEVHSSSNTESVIPESKESQVPDGQQVIIPNHLHVPEADKLGFCFGSFDASFGLSSNTLIGPGPEPEPRPMSDKSPSVSEEITEHIEEHVNRNQDVLATADDEVSSNVGPDQTESKQETSLPVPGHQYPVAHSFIPPIIGSQLAPFESNESQPRDASSVPTFVVQPPFDPVGYFHTPKYNGNVPVLSQSTSQSPQEVGVGPTPLASQAGGVMLPHQQPLPMFRQPTGLHLPHYPPNYIPYPPYYPPFYIPPHGIPQFLSNGAFPQPPPPGSMHPANKYPFQQYKPVTAGNSTSNDDIGGSQFKESNVYVTGQQASSFYNLPQGGQVAYAPTQGPHTTFAGMYQPVTSTPVHPLLQQPQTMAGGADMVGPAYQQPPQINWPNNY